MKILAIETSCDETAAAVVEDGTRVLSSAIASSVALHEKYGGIVPEVASREQLRCILPVIKEALSVIKTGVSASVRQCVSDEIDAIAVTVGPGLIGSLLVGVETAKTIAFTTAKPIIPVNHVLAHMYANCVNSHQSSAISRQQNTKLKADSRKLIAFPAISLVVSGGHTELYLMKSVRDLTWLGGTLDDAAGEAFDKTARLLGFGSRGGVAIQEAAQTFIAQRSSFGVKLPRPMIHDDSLNFSFSGLKTAILREWKKHEVTGSDPVRNAFAYEVQEAITDVLVEKTLRAARKYDTKSILLSGGVAANLRLRKKFSTKLETLSSKLYVPPTALCTDNAVSIASYAYFRGEPADWHAVTAVPDLSVEKV